MFVGLLNNNNSYITNSLYNRSKTSLTCTIRSYILVSSHMLNLGIHFYQASMPVFYLFKRWPHLYSKSKSSGPADFPTHDDVIKWKHFPHNWPFVRGIHRSPVNSPHKGQWRGALMFSLIYVWINDWVNNREAGDLRRCRAHYDAIVMFWWY